MDDENPVDREIAKIDAWLEATGTKESRLGLLACANPHAVKRVRDGTARVETLRQLLDHIRIHPAPKKQD